MAAADDIRHLIADPLAAVRSALARVQVHPATTWTPPPTETDPDPAPVVVPERTEIDVDPGTLPAQVAPLDPLTGQPMVSLPAQLALVLAALAQKDAQQALSVVGRATVTSGQLRAGQTVTVPVAWDAQALAVPTDVTAICLPASPLGMGRASGAAVAGQTTKDGCVIAVTFTGSSPLNLTSALPLTVEAQGRYLYSPPFQP